MARYRRVDVRLWADSRVRDHLSPLAPSGQALWLYLLTGPVQTLIPGLFRCGQAALAEELGWDLADLRRCWGELEAAGMARADWRARLVWLPRAIVHDPPANPNVVASWATWWDELPECPLLLEAWAALRDHMTTRSPGFLSAFDSLRKPAEALAKIDGAEPRQPLPERFPQRLPQPPPDGCRNGRRNQEQEQEQEQEQDALAAPAAPAASPPPLVLTGQAVPKARPPRAPSGAEQAYTWAQQQREAALPMATTDRPLPVREVNARLKPILAEVGGVGFRQAYLGFLADPYALGLAPPCPIAFFLAEWRRYYDPDRARALAAVDTRPAPPADPAQAAWVALVDALDAGGASYVAQQIRARDVRPRLDGDRLVISGDGYAITWITETAQAALDRLLPQLGLPATSLWWEPWPADTTRETA